MSKVADPRKIAFFDIDGTFYRWQLFHEVMIRLAKRDYFDMQLRRDIIEKYHAWKSRIEPYGHFSTASVRAFRQGIAEVPPRVLEQIAGEILDETGHQIYSYTRDLQQKLKNEGYFTLALSGSMQEIIEPFAAKYGFDDALGEIYARKDGKYTGETSRTVVGRKATIIQEYVHQNGFSLSESYAVGDSGGDIDMLEVVAHPIAFNPNDELLAAARKHNWTIVVERKNIAYTLKAKDGLRLLAQTDSL